MRRVGSLGQFWGEAFEAVGHGLDVAGHDLQHDVVRAGIEVLAYPSRDLLRAAERVDVVDQAITRAIDQVPRRCTRAGGSWRCRATRAP